MTSLQTRFDAWKSRLSQANPNLSLVAYQLESFNADDFRDWLEKGLTGVFHDGILPEEAFSPGDYILGSNGRVPWREELLVTLSLLSESARVAAVQGIEKVFDALPPEANLSAAAREPQERKICELLQIVRSLRAPLCASREAMPLPAIWALLGQKYPRNQRVFLEGLLTWQAFVHQCAAWQPHGGWKVFLRSHAHFRDEYIPLVAFSIAETFPERAPISTVRWDAFNRYMRHLANESAYSIAAQDALTRCTRRFKEVAVGVRRVGLAEQGAEMKMGLRAAEFELSGLASQSVSQLTPTRISAVASKAGGHRVNLDDIYKADYQDANDASLGDNMVRASAHSPWEAGMQYA